MIFHHKALYASKGAVPEEGACDDQLGRARVVREGSDVTLVALGAMVPRTTSAAEQLAQEDRLQAKVVDVRSLVPVDVTTILEAVRSTGWLFTIEENPRLCGWGAEVSSLVAEEAMQHLRGPITRITTPHQPLPAARSLEDLAIPSVERIVATVRERLR
jgi:pyruvate dehydrogenase E1 component beta subunit